MRTVRASEALISEVDHWPAHMATTVVLMRAVPGLDARPDPAAPEGDLLYFVESEEDALVKIGVTKDVKANVSLLRHRHRPKHIRLLTAVPGTKEVAASLRTAFAAEREEGEWYRPTLTLYRAVLALKTRLPHYEVRLSDSMIAPEWLLNTR